MYLLLTVMAGDDATVRECHGVQPLEVKERLRLKEFSVT